MSNQSEVFEFYLHGNGVTALSFKAKEVAVVLENLESAITSYLTFTNAIEEKSEFSISLVSAQDASLRLKFLPNVQETLKLALSAITIAISTGNGSSLPPQTIASLHEIQKIIRRKNCIGDFISGQTVGATIDSNTEISIPAKDLIEGETILYSTVLRVGGAKPRARLKVDNYIITCDTSESLARQLAKRLYQEVGLRGVAKWRKQNFLVEHFRIESIIDGYDPTTASQTFREIADIVGKYYQNIDIEKS